MLSGRGCVLNGSDWLERGIWLLICLKKQDICY